MNSSAHRAVMLLLAGLLAILSAFAAIVTILLVFLGKHGSPEYFNSQDYLLLFYAVVHLVFSVSLVYAVTWKKTKARSWLTILQSLAIALIVGTVACVGYFFAFAPEGITLSSRLAALVVASLYVGLLVFECFCLIWWHRAINRSLSKTVA